MSTNDIIEVWVPRAMFFATYPTYQHAIHVQVNDYVVVYECPLLAHHTPFFFTLEDAQVAYFAFLEKNSA